MDKKKPKSRLTPSYDLELFKNLLKSSGTWLLTKRAQKEAYSLGYSDFEILEKLQFLKKDNFKQSLLSEKDNENYLDVYYIDDLYIKFLIDKSCGTQVVCIISFHKKRN